MFREDLYLPHQHVRDSACRRCAIAGRTSPTWPAPAGPLGQTARRAGGRSADARSHRRPAGVRLAGQRPRTGQRDGGAPTSSPGAQDHQRTSAVASAAAAGRLLCRKGAADADADEAAGARHRVGQPFAAKTLKEIEMEHILRVLEQAQRQQTGGRGGARHRSQDALQQAQPVGGRTSQVGRLSLVCRPRLGVSPVGKETRRGVSCHNDS